MHLLSAPEFLDGARPDRVVVLGRPTLFRQVQQLLGDPRVAVDVIAHPHGYADPTGTARIVAAGWPDLRELPDPAWAAHWRDADAMAAKRSRGPRRTGHRGSPRLARDLVAALPRRATLVLGSSQAPRDVGLGSEARDGCRVVANRGVAGIDGTVSTAVGVALAAGNAAAVSYGGADGRSDFPARRQRADDRPARAPPGTDDRRQQQRRRGDLLHPGAGRTAARQGFRPGFRHAPRGDAGRIGRGLRRRARLRLDRDELAEAIADPGGIRVVEVPTSRTDLAPTLKRMTEAVRAAL